MNEIGAFICNYNGKEFALNCIASLLKQSYSGFDIFIIDNASTDGSADAIRQQYQDKVKVLENYENLGGAGGFDRALKEGIQHNYKYIVLLDNDIRLCEDCIQNMREYMDSHREVGIAGSKVMIMDLPDTIQDYGDYLDFKLFKERNAYSNEKDRIDIPVVNECDYVPSCAIMVRTEMVKISGTMPAENFIYYDDIELSYRMKLKGWKIVALGSAKVLHKGGFRKAVENTFSRYYFLRNRLHFFSKFIQEEQIPDFTEIMLSEVFSRLYGFHIKGLKEVFDTTQYAFDDFLHHKYGKAEEHKILKLQPHITPLERIVLKKKNINVYFMDNFMKEKPNEIFGIFYFIIRNIHGIAPGAKISMSLNYCTYSMEQVMDGLKKEINTMADPSDIPDFNVVPYADPSERFDLEFKICEHVNLVTENILPLVYIDRYCNCISSEKEYVYFSAYTENEQFFKNLYRPMFLQSVKKIREES